MSFVIHDVVRDVTSTTGTGAFALAGLPIADARPFNAVMAGGQTCYYRARHQTAAEWEVGVATYVSANTLARTTILASSNAGGAVDFSAGAKDVSLVIPAARAVVLHPNGNLGVGTASPQTRVHAVGQDGTVALFAGASNAMRVSFGANGSALEAVDPTGFAEWRPLQLVGSSVAIAASGVEGVRVSPSGNVGIGTGDPDNFFGAPHKLVIAGNVAGAVQDVIHNSATGQTARVIRRMIGGTGNSLFQTILADNNGAPFVRHEHGSAVQFADWTLGGAVRLKILSSGNVGLNTDNPLGNLDLGNSGATINVATNSAIMSNLYFSDQFRYRANGIGAFIKFNRPEDNGGSFEIAFTPTSNNAGANAPAAPAPVVNVMPSGRMGVLTVDPTTALHVNGPIRCGSYTRTTLPAAAAVGAGAMIWVSNPQSGAARAFWSNGTDWRDQANVEP